MSKYAALAQQMEQRGPSQRLQGAPLGGQQPMGQSPVMGHKATTPGLGG